MKTYKTRDAKYEVFSVNMTMDTQTDMRVGSELFACKSCQCHCRTCLGGKAPEGAEVFCRVDAEKALERLLAA